MSELMMSEAMTPPPSQPEVTAAKQKFIFSPSDGEFMGLCLRGGGLTVLTLGLYRFWFLTNTRRLLWRKTMLGADGFEYTGNGRELFFGFLVAIGILAPAYLLGFLLSIEAERYRAFSGLPVFFAFTLFGIFASYRARRYRLTRTVFRGVRFGMTGSSWAFTGRYLGWGLLTIVTLGLAYPWMSASLERYKMANTFYGSLRGAFEGRGWMLFKRGVIFWLLLPIGLAIAVAAMANHRPGAALLGYLVALPAYPMMRGTEWRWWVEGVRLGPVHAVPKFGKAFVLVDG